LGATKVRLTLSWASIVPDHIPANFDAADPSDRHYRWSSVDQQVRLAVKAGLEPILDIVDAPDWARLPAPSGDTEASLLPAPTPLGRFAQAAARRFSGKFEHLPRVRYWQVWNEPNLGTYIKPQLLENKPVAPRIYGAMVNAVASAVKSVRADNLVIAGGLAPFRDLTPQTYAQDADWGPLSFMRELLCVSPKLQPTCKSKVRFDIWSTHPYTSGGPTHKAELPNDVSLGDLPRMRALLRAAGRAHHIVSGGDVQFWVTEFSWDSSPPDPGGVPIPVLEHWVPQALYEMWRSGVSLVTWFSLQDQPMSSTYQAGFYYDDGRPKPFLEGFRFPLVAFRRANGVYVWGRTPWGTPGKVRVQQDVGGRWTRLGTVKTDEHGIFQHTFHVTHTGSVRGVLAGGGEQTLPFSLDPVPDHYYKPFGSQMSDRAAGHGR
jgi:hypothetical protein